MQKVPRDSARAPRKLESHNEKRVPLLPSRPSARATAVRAIAVLERCGNNWRNGKGGCGPLLHDEYAPTLPTMFQPFVVARQPASRRP